MCKHAIRAQALVRTVCGESHRETSTINYQLKRHHGYANILLLSYAPSYCDIRILRNSVYKTWFLNHVENSLVIWGGWLKSHTKGCLSYLYIAHFHLSIP